jgi:uncharacterized protein DUF2459
MGKLPRGSRASEGARRSRRTIPRRALQAAAILSVLYLLTAWLGGCAQPIDGLWPPRPGERTHRIIVSIDTWHSMVGVWPEDQPDGKEFSALTEWGYAQKAYYLEGDNGCSGTLRALLIPSTSVVHVARAGRPWSERTPQPPARQWSFLLTEKGYRNLLEFLEAEKASSDPIVRGAESQWYLGAHDYCALHHCHHWTAQALRCAGLPVWSFYGLFKWTLERQLDRAAKLASAR